MKRVLVTGSNGLLGQKIIDLALAQSDISLVATSSGSNRHPIKAGYTFQELDVCATAALRAAILQHQPQAVIHTAAMTNVDACESNQEACEKLNVTAVISLATLCQEFNIQLVHLSTDFIFDGADGPYTEDASPNPLSFYGQSKWKAEQAIVSSGCTYAILRTIIVYGVAAEMSRSNIVLWAKNALEKGETISVVNDQWRMPTLAEDLAAACLAAVQKEAQGVFHVSGKDFMNMVELVQQVADFWNLDKTLIRPITSSSLNQEAKRPPKTGFVLAKAIAQLNYQPHSFVEGLALVDAQLKA
jgi:dTDP-4-dehydrorhamnose reductase